MTFHTIANTPYARGRSDALKGLQPSSQDYDYQRGYHKGRLRKSKNGKYTSNTASQTKAAEDSMRDKWGVKRFAKAKRCPASIREGESLEGQDAEIAGRAGGLILNSNIASDGFQAYIDAHSKQIEKLVLTLPIAPWVKSVRGLGLCSVGCIIGESGDLHNYANPAKLWKRLGLAPFNGKMPSSWRSQGGLTKEEWTEIGYNPRRRSVLYVVSECLVKQNDGVYRAKYDTAKAAKLALNDDKWPKLRCHRHGMLLAVKELVLDLWLQWHGKAKTARPA